jgi:cyclophilin family peptidyl-prolyl cis-trans isomerase
MFRITISQLLAASGVGVLALAVACHAPSNSAPMPITDSSSPRAALGDPDNAFWRTRAPAVFVVRIETTRGDFTIESHRAWAPRGVDRFYQLVRAGFFDDSRFYRVRAGFIAQFGIAGDPVIARLWRDRRIPDDSVRETNVRGTVAFAMTGPDTRTTQVYIDLRDNTSLDAQGFAPIGRVRDGMDVVETLDAEYGEQAGGGMRAGQQAPLFAQGNAYLDRAFPHLDHLVRATIVSEP